MRKKILGLMAVAAFSVLALGATSAMAITPGVATPPWTVSGVSSGAISLGGVISCNSTVSGTITVDHGAGAGGGGPISTAGFTSCGLNSATATNLPWALDVTDTNSDGVGEASITGIHVTLKILGGLLTCHYSGSLSGSYTPSTGALALSGSLTRAATDSTSCPSPSTVSGTYNLTDNSSAGHIPQL
jgi:hypothetical protein